MTPQLQQAIKLLQMSNLELQGFVEQELERNPLLERDESAPGPREEQPEPPAASQTETALTLSENTPPADASVDLDTDYDNVYGEDSACDRAGETAGDSGPSSWSDVRGGGRFDGEDALSLEVDAYARAEPA